MLFAVFIKIINIAKLVQFALFGHLFRVFLPTGRGGEFERRGVGPSLKRRARRATGSISAPTITPKLQ
ncbi:hypothetical protein AGR6A_pb0081 [Agrobacterium sp. NCPPB 925]|nr:hypothetical protein AGR6A_pb0081 [Agrobacterium sp. NCPPB 925]